MTNSKKELAVAALRNGTVIDHIPSDALFTAVRILGLENAKGSVTIGMNLHSNKIGSKGIIKVADVEFADDLLNRIALIAPTAVVNIIREYEVVEKRPVVLHDTVVGIVRCPNPKCITNNEPMATKFHVVSRDPIAISCHYCSHVVKGSDAVTEY
ncbi:MAG: aspartate carbamoyltransferase regulatory subunit [Muribaculaceae bacterium]|mgnify:CR=1 FL=1|nr:aspartate carbamoyltransferase regulatory subunit [Muribaculaceae bacterium]